MVKGTPMARSTWEGWSDPEVQARAGGGADAQLVDHQQDGLAFDEFEADIAGIGQPKLPVAVHPAVGDAGQEGVLQLIPQGLHPGVFFLHPLGR